MLNSSIAAGLAARQAISCLCISALPYVCKFQRGSHTASALSRGNSSPSAGGPGFDALDAPQNQPTGKDDFRGMLQKQLEQTSARLAAKQQVGRRRKACSKCVHASNAHSCLCLYQVFEVVQGAGQPSCSTTTGYVPDQTSSAVVRMESQLIFDSCWRRFKERHGMVRVQFICKQMAAGRTNDRLSDPTLEAAYWPQRELFSHLVDLTPVVPSAGLCRAKRGYLA